MCEETQPVVEPGASAPHQTKTTEDATSTWNAGKAVRLEIARIPGYETLELLGRGGMGVVYKARQLVPERTVAVKFLLSGQFASHNELSRFQREADAAAALQHPGIVQIHAAGRHEGVPFLVLEFVEGGSLSALLRRTTLSSRQAAEALRQLARATELAHQKGIVHRDLKPGNVLLSPKEATEGSLPWTLKIADFGLARYIPGIADFEPGGPKTQTGEILGTPHYMAPEQAMGNTSAIGPAADVYALGVILFESLTGRRPFESESTVELLRKIVHDPPMPLQEVNPNVPPDLQTLCLRCLEKSPVHRPTCRELADDMQRYLDGTAIELRPRSRLARLRGQIRQRPVSQFLAAGALCALVVTSLLIGLPRLKYTGGQGRIGADQADAGAVPPSAFLPTSDTQREIVDRDVGDAERIRLAAAKVVSQNNLKQIAIALQNYAATYGALPPPAIMDAKGTPLLSWRVAILPFIEQNDLYKQFRLDEPWDSEHNKQLLVQMPSTYDAQGQIAPRGFSLYRSFVGPGTAFEHKPRKATNDPRGLSLNTEFPDGLEKTLLVVEAAEPVPWTKPDEIRYDSDATAAMPPIGGWAFSGISHAAFVNGQVEPLDISMEESTLRALITRNGGEDVFSGWKYVERAE